ncbi:TetR/AcrR family transcriptional regulator [Streptomyces sp. WAC 01529]|uniref:TetR/AcrR family transcriptional regulator n=1 Tax=Streptomyces sp. WAC 01529 TaxID=2203205 RepID=UPI000F71457B|nr:TetR/AcrR family transcriptional regulator [Streptomyces sp. WAC 01529]AZM57805.1 TetR/AcrR family transcriptional regulator [Streptomyces sp. WAC 01529]
MSPKQQRGAETAERLLDAALQVYAESGEQGVTVSALTKASGVSLGSLYHHFGSVDGLMRVLLLRWLGRLLEELAGGVERARTAKGAVRALVRVYLTFIQEHPDASRLLHSSYADRVGMAQAAQLRDAQEARLSPLTAWVRLHTESGEIAALEAPMVEALVMGPIVATARRWLSGIDDADLDQAARVLPERIWRSISP